MTRHRSGEDLRQRRHVALGRVDRHHTTEQRAESARVAYVVDPDTCVDEHEAVRVGLDQQAVRNQLGTREEAPFTVHGALAAGAHRAAVEVMDAHAQLARRAAVAAPCPAAVKLRSQRGDPFSAVSNLFFTAALLEFVKYCPEMLLTSGDEAKYTDVRAPVTGEIERAATDK